MRKIIELNNNWYFQQNYQIGCEKSQSYDDFEKVNLPHSNVLLPYNYFDEEKYQIVSCYKYQLCLPKDYDGRLIYLHFEGVMTYAKVYLNGVFAGEHKGGYTPFDIRIDEIYQFDLTSNIITVVVDSTEREDIPPFGGQIDYLTYGGIYREVSVQIFDRVFIKNVKIETEQVLMDEKNVYAKVHIQNTDLIECEAKIITKIKEKNGKYIYNGESKVKINGLKNEIAINIAGLIGIKLWDLQNPNLYEIETVLEVQNIHDEYIDTFGFRKAEFTANGFYLNGKRLKIVGLNRHQSYPYVGYAMPKRVQEKDAEILKRELHLNLVRTAHYPQSIHFLNKCDELGLLVFEEIPGWQHIGNDEWKEVSKQNVKEMIERDWNHPSIVLWGVRINESPDDDYYLQTNSIARKLDTSRQTGGVRCITGSNLLEDVYTFNEFNHDGVKEALRNQKEVTGLEYDVPYLVTEYNGHMFPTKRFDQEERQMEHTLRHLRVQNASFEDDSICGAIGWCAFDYNTHKDFGSGDRICYHGVMDMFRIPKFAAYAYKAQISPEIKPVLEPITLWARGERSEGGIIPLVVVTNCDYIEYKYGKLDAKKVYPDKDTFKGLPYAPIIIDYSVLTTEEAGSWGMSWEDALITGYYNNKPVVVRKLSKNPVPTELSVIADDLVLSKDQKDATRIIVKVLDQCGNILPFLDDIIKINIDGPAVIQGPSELVLKGGAIGFWVETLNEAGRVKVEVSSGVLGSKVLEIDIK